MNDNDLSDEPTDEEIRRIEALLGDPELWDEPDLSDEEAIVAAILAESGGAVESAPTATSVAESPPALSVVESEVLYGDSDASAQSVQSPPSNVVPISRARSWVVPVISVAAGVLLALVSLAAINSLDSRPDGEVALALEGTDLAPEAEAEALIVGLNAGTRIELDVSDLPPAAPGTYYEVWLRQDAEVGVSAGTFHLRGGDSAIELWAGVLLEDYPLVTVTIQDEAEPTSSGRVVLKGLFEGS